MMSEPSPISDTLVWCDLETTGTEDEDIILEVAVIVTDNNLDEIDAFSSLVIDCNPKNLIPSTGPRSKDSDIPCWGNHFETGLVRQLILESNMDDFPTVKTVQEKLLRFLASHGIVAGMEARPPLCGSSVQFDRRFLGRYMPEVLKVLHYRNIDVSTVRELQKRWSPGMPVPEKQGAHRALDDIRESIGLLKSMRASGFVG